MSMDHTGSQILGRREFLAAATAATVAGSSVHAQADLPKSKVLKAIGAGQIIFWGRCWLAGAAGFVEKWNRGHYFDGLTGYFGDSHYDVEG